MLLVVTESPASSSRLLMVLPTKPTSGAALLHLTPRLKVAEEGPVGASGGLGAGEWPGLIAPTTVGSGGRLAWQWAGGNHQGQQMWGPKPVAPLGDGLPG